MAGTTRLQYPAGVRLVRLPCTGRMSPLFILKAFEQGADGVLVSGCHPGDCHYVQGNLIARRRFAVFRSLLDFLGVDLRRLHFAWVSAAEGQKWARVVHDVTASVTEAGPLRRLSAAGLGRPRAAVGRRWRPCRAFRRRGRGAAHQAAPDRGGAAERRPGRSGDRLPGRLPAGPDGAGDGDPRGGLPAGLDPGAVSNLATYVVALESRHRSRW